MKVEVYYCALKGVEMQDCELESMSKKRFRAGG